MERGYVALMFSPSGLPYVYGPFKTFKEARDFLIIHPDMAGARKSEIVPLHHPDQA